MLNALAASYPNGSRVPSSSRLAAGIGQPGAGAALLFIRYGFRRVWFPWLPARGAGGERGRLRHPDAPGGVRDCAGFLGDRCGILLCSFPDSVVVCDLWFMTHD